MFHFAIGKHKIQGISAGIVPPLLDFDIVEEVIKVSSDHCSLSLFCRDL